MAKLVEQPAPAALPTELGPCRVWAGKPRPDGYAHTRVGKARRNVLIHVQVFELVEGRCVRPGMQLDHLCSVRNCASRLHLEEVTPKENSQRVTRLITHCPAGHPYTGPNLRVDRHGHRFCRACGIARAKAWRERRTA